MAECAVLGLGTASFLADYGIGTGGLQDKPLSLLESALTRGVSYLDTASAYGESELWIGRLPAPLRQTARVCTKLKPDELPQALGDSLQRLQLPSVDTLLVHSARERDLTDERLADGLCAARAAGQIERAGASTYGAADAVRLLQQPWCDVVQIEHSVLNPAVVPVLKHVRRPGQEVVVRSILCKGLLTPRRRLAAYLPCAAQRRLDRLEALATSWEYTLPELAVRFALDTPGVDVVVVGVSSRTELDVALSACDRPRLEASLLEALREFDCSAEDWTHPERWQGVR
jgi:aryl-alcohol dehydrogenase-like predicted oxidoreductase